MRGESSPVTAVLSVVGGGAPELVDGFDVAYVTVDGTQSRVRLEEAWSLRLEFAAPVRRFPSYKGQRHLPGLWFSATTGSHIGYESWLERDQLMALDFDPEVVGIASQPLWLFWTDERGKARSHAPDYFVRRADGSAVVIDCRPEDRRKPRDLAVFETTRRACELIGWEYWLVGLPDPVRAANLRWLAGYRHPRHLLPDVAGPLRRVFDEPLDLLAGAQAVGDPIAVLPVLFHLLWRHDLVTELSVPLHQASVVRTAGGA